MILSGLEIKHQLGKNIFIEPFNENHLNPNSYNLTLHNELLVYSDSTLDMFKNNPCEKIFIPADGFVLQPNTLYLARTVEHTKTLGFVPMLEGRSSIGRLGICIHATAGFGDVGFAGFWTLELFCVQPVRIYSGVQIAQIYFHTVSVPYKTYDGGKYQNNTDIQPSLFYKERSSP